MSREKRHVCIVEMENSVEVFLKQLLQRFSLFGETGLESLCLTTEGKQGAFGPKCNVTSELETE